MHRAAVVAVDLLAGHDGVGEGEEGGEVGFKASNAHPNNVARLNCPKCFLNLRYQRLERFQPVVRRRQHDDGYRHGAEVLLKGLVLINGDKHFKLARC